ncbi:Phage integrase [uncultured Leptolyngbya sp.]|uniref:Phage integrase n=1 Tax=uncultured Leptolyngbya sp. TaxID=332963 RepID=A0A6J4KMU2_9CYAN|nr:Phage integrase [uncultured Leptolyngbya sp.]
MRDPQALPSVRLIQLESALGGQIPTSAKDLRSLRVEEFLQARSLSLNSQKVYRRELARFLNWTDRPLGEITPRQIVQFKVHLREQRLAVASINRALAALKSFFKWLSQAYPTLVERNPAPSVSLEKLPLPPPRDLSPQELGALYEALAYRGETQVRDTAVLSMLGHGLRASEVCSLNVEDYDGVRLTIRQAKDDSTGTVPLAEAARSDLDHYLSWRQEQGELLQPHLPLFVTQGHRNPGERLGYKGLYYIIKDLGAIAGIDQLTPHRLRHTYATGLLLRGMDSLHARTLTRHKSEVTFQRYAKRAKAAAAEQAFYAAIGEEAPAAN